jgi:hypothetical protein
VGDNALHPRHPDRICWGCEKLCPANDLACGGGTIRTQHPVELFGDDWEPPDAVPAKPNAAAMPEPHAD